MAGYLRIEEKDEDFSGFSIVERKSGERDYLDFIILKEEETQMSKPWRKTLIIKFLGRLLSLGALVE